MVSNSTFSPSGEQEFGYGQLAQVLLRRWPWIIGALSLGIAGAVYTIFQDEPVYKSSMQMLVSPNFETDIPLTSIGESLQNSSADASDYATQLALMRSDQFILEAVKRLQDTYPNLTPEDIKQTFLIYQIVSDNNKNTTRIFEATFVGSDPTQTQQILETLQDIYIEYNRNQQEERLTRGLAYVDRQLANTENSLRESQTSLQDFREGEQLIDPTLQGQNLVDRLNQVQIERRQVIAEQNSTASKYQALERQLSLNPQTGLLASRLSQSARVQTLLNTLQETSLALAERRILFTDQDPSVQLLVDQYESQKAQLRQEIGTILGQPVQSLDQELLSYLQLGNVDINIVAQLVELNSNLAALDARAKSLLNVESMLRNELTKFPALIAEYDRLQPRAELERATLARLLAQREQLTSELARGGFTWEVVEPPQLGYPINSSPVRNLMLGVVAGLFLGGLLAFVREMTDNVLHTSDELQRQMPVPLLGMLPLQTRGRLLSFGRRDSALPPILHPELAESDLLQIVSTPTFREAMDMVTNNLQLRTPNPEHKTFTITSGLLGEGKTTVALGLALSLTRMNQRVLLIDADLRRSGLQSQLGIDSESGLSTFLSGSPTATRPHRLDLGFAHLDILPAGPVPNDPLPLLSSHRFSDLLARSRDIYDVILIDTPPVLGLADAVKIGSVCDGTIVVSRLDRITQKELTAMLTLLAPLKILGLIANGAKDSPSRSAYDAPVPDLQKALEDFSAQSSNFVE